MDVRTFPAVAERVETGPMQFGDDWPGVFIRGDNAFAYAMALEFALQNPEQNVLYRAQALRLVSLLRGCIVQPAQAIEARSDETRSGSAEGESAVRQDAPKPPNHPNKGVQ